MILLMSMAAPAAVADSETTPPFDELFVSYWPEYDNTDPNASVLVLYSGKLPDDVKLPAKINLHVPKNSKVFAATVVDAGGKLLKVPYDQQNDGDFDEITYEINNREFQLELYHYPAGEGANRAYSFDFRTSAPVKTLGFEIQKPLAATNFKVDPASANVREEARQNNSNPSFEYHGYEFSNVPRGKDYSFKVAYNKPDTKPSIDPQSAPTASGITGDTNRSPGLLVFLLLMGLFGVAVGVIVTIRARSASGQPTERAREPSRPVATSRGTTRNFCGSCGTRLQEDANFCYGCGAAV